MLVILFLLRIAFDSPEFSLLGFNLTDNSFLVRVLFSITP
jgi:hypothetical protein